jgi:tRNA G18 (ribose-2'-O)-methylase SpoU
MSIRKTMDDLGRMTADEHKATGKFPLIVIMDDIRSMHNVGSVFRTCDAFGIQSVLLCGYTPCPPHRDIHKTALGATETVNWQYFGSTIEAIQSCRDQGYAIVAVEQTHGSISLEQFNYSGQPLALIFGNEVGGVCQPALGAADQYLEIPQWGTKHSLNISVSAGVVLWEMVRKFKTTAVL